MTIPTKASARQRFIPSTKRAFRPKICDRIHEDRPAAPPPIPSTETWSNRPAVPLGSIVGAVLILASLNMPILDTGVLGPLLGLIFGVALSPFWRPEKDTGG